ncbi:MAG: LytTR family DNA-binding domain-containing protein [Clostridiales bacterium]|nr:LytTR family DNA-binding domain-containing protein [Clostridiales bacterium]
MVNLKTAIVEDDHYFAKLFQSMVYKTGKISSIDTYYTGEDFLNALKNDLTYDVVFLDIKLPGIEGYELGALVKKTDYMQVVFVTGLTDRAADAFDIEAADYLVKPFKQERLNRCIGRVLKKLHPSDTKKILIKGKKETVLEDESKIIFIEKMARKVILYTTKKTYELYNTIANIEGQLNDNFIRSHKSYIVNINYVKESVKWGDRAYLIKFNYTDKTALLSRGKTHEFKVKLKNIGVL